MNILARERDFKMVFFFLESIVREEVSKNKEFKDKHLFDNKFILVGILKRFLSIFSVVFVRVKESTKNNGNFV